MTSTPPSTQPEPLPPPLPRSLARVATLSTAVLAVVASVLLVAGCASPGPQAAPAVLRAPADLGLGGAPTSAVASQWWQAFGDAELNALVQRALADQPSLQLAQARLARASAGVAAVRGEDGPQVALNASAMRQHYSAHGLVPYPIAGNLWNSGDVTVGLGWDLDLWGRQRAALAAALGNERAAQAEAAAVGNALATQIVRGYVGLARLVAQREVAARTLAQRDEMLGLIRQRVAAGLDTRVELRQGEAALPDTRVTIESLDEQIRLAQHQLAALSGQAPQALDALTPKLAALKAADVAGGADAAPGLDLLGRRPDVVAARWRVEATSQDVAVARTRFYPDVRLSAFVGLSALGLDRLIDVDSRTYGAGPALRLPIFEGGQLRAQLQGKAAERDAAIAQYNQTVVDAVREAADALTSQASLQRQRAEQAQAQAGVEAAYDLAQQRYRAGLGNYLLVLNAESQVLAQRRLAVDLAARTLDTQAALMKALGGGWASIAAPAAASPAASTATLAAR
ncbi:MAG TPA: efflux transporter outer membrane subunit [Burkholderiaceae bacterium]|nr:efflux transporter outer membrane subunit [Burkholderiaceae bacterium]